MRRRVCSQAELHWQEPRPNYLAFDEWHRQMQSRYRNRQCPGCGLWVIWEMKNGE